MASATRRRPKAERIPIEERDPARNGPRKGAKRTVLHYIRQLPNFVRLLFGLITDPRVALIDKALVFGAIAYIVTPIDLIPDFIPFIGEVDDVYLLVIALQRLISNAGRLVLLDHWGGDAEDLADLNLQSALAAAAFFLPRRIRRRLRVIGR
ncbi:MAG TPA: DUF1232 domain-containing protein [Gemmatimonadaceae bacterium]|nr:DUF1232 domain-containing protein [Gemmatimonadaceae bacterium]